MFNWYNNNPYGYYGMPMPNTPNMQNQNFQQNSNFQNPTERINTNKVFVNGIDGARTLQLQNNSCVLACDNDLDLLYEITVDGTGKRSIKVFDIFLHKENPKPTYVTQEEFSGFKNEIQELVKGIKKEGE